MTQFKFTLSALSLLAASVASQPAHAVPLVYQCTLVDYLQTGPVVTEFQYSQVGESKTFNSEHSQARIYLDESHRLVLNLRQRLASGQAAPYATTDGYDLPKRLALTIASPSSTPDGEGYASRLACEI